MPIQHLKKPVKGLEPLTCALRMPKQAKIKTLEIIEVISFNKDLAKFSSVLTFTHSYWFWTPTGHYMDTKTKSKCPPAGYQ